MSQLGTRIQDLRKQKGFTQAELALKVKVSLTQMQRYEAKGVQPPANVLLKIADVLDTSVDFLISGDKNQRIKQALKDAELINQFKAVEQMNDKDKNIIKALIDAFITKKQLQKLM
jgi:transcriptional regulator with XRE-family HTH domain